MGDSLQDLRDAEVLGLPYATHWACRAKISNQPGNPVVPGGFTFDYHYGRMAAGHRFIPSIYAPPLLTGTGANNYVLQHVTPYASLLKAISDQRLPLCVRSDNIGAFAYSGRYTIGVGLWNKDNTPKRWHYDANGVPQDDAVVDLLAPPDAWIQEATLVGNSVPFQALYGSCPAPLRVLMAYNNEEAKDAVGNYVNADRVTNTWKDAAVIAAKSQRVVDARAAYAAGVTCDQLAIDFGLRGRDLYQTYHSRLMSTMPAAWAASVRTVCYGGVTDPKTLWAPHLGFSQIGYAPGVMQYGGCLPQRYATGVTVPYTSATYGAVAAWRAVFNWARANNPTFVPGVSVQYGSTGALIGPRTGAHPLMTPERYAGYVTWLMWTLHEPGVPFEVKCYEDSTSLRADLVFNATEQAELATYGRSDLATVTKEQTCEPVYAAVDHVGESPTLRTHWLSGDPVIIGGPCPADSMVKKYGFGPMPSPDDVADRRWRVLPCSLNDPSSMWQWNATTQQIGGNLKVYSAATRINNDILVFAWSPLDLSAPVDITVPGVGTFLMTINDPRGNYMLIKPDPTIRYVTELVS